MNAKQPKNTSEYLANVPKEQRAALEQLRQVIKAAAPQAEECISYGLPSFRLNGPLVAFGAAAKHCSFYPMSGSLIEKLEDELNDFETSKGTIRFQPGKPIPTALIRKMVKARITENKSSKLK